MFCSAIAAACSALSRTASSPPCTLGCSVLTRPSIISGKPVWSDTSFTASPASRSALAVPPVDSSSTPCRASACPSATSPALSDTESSARVTLTPLLFLLYFYPARLQDQATDPPPGPITPPNHLPPPAIYAHS